MGYEKHSKEFRTGASNSKATRFRKLFGKTFSLEKVFVLKQLTKSANLSSKFFQLWKNLNKSKQTIFILMRSIMYTQPYTYTQQIPLSLDDGHGDYNRSYERSDDDFDYADYSTDHRDNNFRNYEKKRRKTNKEIIEDMLKRWD